MRKKKHIKFVQFDQKTFKQYSLFDSILKGFQEIVTLVKPQPETLFTCGEIIDQL